MSQPVNVVRRRSSVDVKPNRKNSVKVGRWGAVRIFHGGQPVKDRETILAMVGRKV